MFGLLTTCGTDTSMLYNAQTVRFWTWVPPWKIISFTVLHNIQSVFGVFGTLCILILLWTWEAWWRHVNPYPHLPCFEFEFLSFLVDISEESHDGLAETSEGVLPRTWRLLESQDNLDQGQPKGSSAPNHWQGASPGSWPALCTVSTTFYGSHETLLGGEGIERLHHQVA